MPNPFSTQKDQMYDQWNRSNKRLTNEAKRLRRKLREHGGLSPGDAARLRRVSGRAAKVCFQEFVQGRDEND